MSGKNGVAIPGIRRLAFLVPTRSGSQGIVEVPVGPRADGESIRRAGHSHSTGDADAVEG
jgi:hypothetical protein